MNQRKPEIIIKTEGITGTQVYVDGRKLEGVTGVRFSQSYRERSGLPILQIDMKATNVTLGATMLPTLPEPFSGHYIPINALANLKSLSTEEFVQMCRDWGIDISDREMEIEKGAV